MQAANKKKCFTYQRRRPELTPCYRILQEELDTFLADRQAENRPVPDYVVEEFAAYLKCGILSHGTIPMRYWLQANRKLYAKIHKLMTLQIHKYYIDKAAANGIKDPKPGSISFTQRWGSALNLNVHSHILCPDGVYTNVGDEPRFRNIEPITDDEVAALVERIAQAVMRYLKKMGYLDKEGEIVQNPKQDDQFSESESLSLATECSIAGKIASPPHKALGLCGDPGSVSMPESM